ncbi:hypothetical protein C8024_15000 [Sphingopyxis sp. BSNA05]|uniref:hypothetical protein n=1 Tax=Sphingopyxis sp. BSNA05 TaxID=1236614 RepID=UPI00156758D5|nr:hypothetical protein [Sphingopyxis sp. BSNA05]NRD90486.1 hypothetical protein [Sphingopyxis sp. BSNA05]
MTEEGWAEWTGPCFLGQAEGKGIATYEDGIFATIEGHFDGGIPQGEVEITYSSGAKYSGSLKDGEYHGFGTRQASWGEAYSGNWNEGYRDGIGRYTGQDGKIVEGLWDRGRLIGSWFSAANTDCEIWWAGTGSDPVGTLAWDGACVNGRANGPGKIDWTDETPAAASGATIEFRGTLSGGKLNGEGVWTQTNRYSNVIHRKVSKGTWVDGAREGYGTDVKRANFWTAVSREQPRLTLVVGKMGNSPETVNVSTPRPTTMAVLSRRRSKVHLLKVPCGREWLHGIAEWPRAKTRLKWSAVDLKVASSLALAL